MAIAPTGDIYKALEFDGESSRSYGVYITGEAVYNAPERDVEMISIPGRNGSYALDKGRFQNIEVTYPAGIFADNETDFRNAISDFRNFLCSRNGYVRLTDEYNPNEYRMAVYKSGLEVDPTMLKAGEFNITFECKPQRWMLSGESELSVTSGDTIMNPTLFDASPMLEVEGYGTIEFNGYEIELYNENIGNVYIQKAGTFAGTGIDTILDATIYKTTDTLYITGLTRKWALQDYRPISGTRYTINSVSAGTDSGSGTTTMTTSSYGGYTLINGTTTFSNISFRLDQDYSASNTYTFTVNATPDSGTAQNYTTVAAIYIYYRVSTKRLQIYVQFTQPCTTWNGHGINQFSTTNGIVVYSTIKALGHPTYIDCELGEAYMVQNNNYTLLNQYIDLGSDLPKLASGANTITFDNTITDLQITPRWWKV